MLQIAAAILAIAKLIVWGRKWMLKIISNADNEIESFTPEDTSFSSSIIRNW